MRRADVAQVCNNVGFPNDDGAFECSKATSARQIASERWREGGGLKHVVLAATSAFDSKTGNFKVVKVSRAMQWSGLTEEKQKNQLAQTEFQFTKTTIIIRGGNYSLVFAFTSALHSTKRRQISR